MNSEAWIAWKLLFSRRSLFGGSGPLALLGLTLGVGSLVASMGVFSGFEAALSRSMSDVSGHVQVIQRGRTDESAADLEKRIRELEPSLVASAPFLRVEALLAHEGKIQGVFMQGVDSANRERVLSLESRVVEGVSTVEPEGDVPGVLVGKGIAQQFHLKPGSHLRLVIPVSDSFDPEKFSRKIGEFVVRGVVDLGKYDWNERFLLTDLAPLQKLADVGTRYSGLLLHFPNAEVARTSSSRLGQGLGGNIMVTDWYELNANLFEAARLERVVIFLVVYIIVIMAAFNVASTLFVNVIRRTDEIALLKSLGLSRKALIRVFGAQGLFFGLAGFLAGSAVGAILCFGFTALQEHYHLMPGSVYKVEGIRAVIRMSDLGAIAFATLGICLLAALAPAWRGARLSPVEGLRYE